MTLFIPNSHLRKILSPSTCGIDIISTISNRCCHQFGHFASFPNFGYSFVNIDGIVDDSCLKSTLFS